MKRDRAAVEGDYEIESGRASHRVVKLAARCDVDGQTHPFGRRSRTIADLFKYRNKIGLDVALEALDEVWRTTRASVDKMKARPIGSLYSAFVRYRLVQRRIVKRGDQALMHGDLTSTAPSNADCEARHG